MKKISVGFAVSLILLLIGCNTSTEKNNGPAAELVPIAVEINMQSETVNPGEEVLISATVTQGDEAVKDADEVKFEIKQVGSEESEFLEGEHSSEGVYSIKKTFEEEAVYNVTAHVTARSMHTMPRIEVIVGNPDKTNEETSTEDSHEHSHSQHGNGHVSIEIHLEKEYTVNSEVNLQASIEEAGSPLHEANVRFEIWKMGNEKHEFIDTREEDTGMYATSYTFNEPGTYHIQVHVEKGDIHEHLEKTVTVN